MGSEFYIHHDKFQYYSDQAIDWFIKSMKYPYHSDEWQICRLKQRIFTAQAIKHLKEAQKLIK